MLDELTARCLHRRAGVRQRDAPRRVLGAGLPGHYPGAVQEPAFDGCDHVEPLATGPVSDTYRAVQRSLGRPVLIKALSPGLLATSPFAATLEREARGQAALCHQNAVALHEMVREGDRLWLVLEWVDGPSLPEVLAARAGPLPPGLGVSVSLGVARALAHAHARGVLHGNLSPAVVAITRRGEVKVSGFGASALGEGAMPVGEEVEVLRYASPERVLGEPLTPRSDVFSLGVMLFEMLAGRRPFDDDAGRTSAQRIRQDAPPSLGSAPPPLARLVERLLAKAAEDRPESAEVVQELERIAGQLAPPPVERWTQRELLAMGFPMEPPEGAVAAAQPHDGGHGPVGPPRWVRGLAVAFALLACITAVFAWLSRGQGAGGPASGARLELQPALAGSLRVVAEPWAHVVVDGQRVETTPFARPIPLAPGPHLVRLEHPQAPHELRRIEIAPGETLLLDVVMQVSAPRPEDAAADASGGDAGGSP